MYVVVSQVTTRRRGATLASRCPSHRELTMTRPLFETVFIATACLFAAAGCSRLRHIDLPSFGVRPAASRAPSAASLASQYGCTSQQAAANWQGVAERARSLISEIELPEGKLSCSAGVAAVTGAEAFQAGILNAADAALYEAKREGRDRTRLARP